MHINIWNNSLNTNQQFNLKKNIYLNIFINLPVLINTKQQFLLINFKFKCNNKYNIRSNNYKNHSLRIYETEKKMILVKISTNLYQTRERTDILYRFHHYKYVVRNFKISKYLNNILLI